MRSSLSGDQGCDVRIVSGGGLVDGLDELARARQAGISQSLALESAKPDLDLVWPVGVGEGAVTGDVGMGSEPIVILSCVSRWSRMTWVSRPAGCLTVVLARSSVFSPTTGRGLF